jgi:hypothetical protein
VGERKQSNGCQGARLAKVTTTQGCERIWGWQKCSEPWLCLWLQNYIKLSKLIKLYPWNWLSLLYVNYTTIMLAKHIMYKCEHYTITENINDLEIVTHIALQNEEQDTYFWISTFYLILIFLSPIKISLFNLQNFMYICITF